ncbi:hypothetical protein [Clostridium saccharobutylicum]|uniref:Uncharacterized protein n=1 Tax=Clostridium saccharobutylicum TaxID=169679 RepID=A0A1S8MND3_CLOSA|nr:hypothetical protein [Clostridium saccharobutylicum]OOM05702.1 hypothetical protein CLOSAC_45720 [Clostridium saccharobutylicum]
MENINVWQEARKKIKLGIRENFIEIRKMMGYKNEEKLSRILGITRQTLAKFGDVSESNGKTNNTLLISILLLIDRFIYINRYDYDNIRNYLLKFNTYFFKHVWDDENLRKQVQAIDASFFAVDLEKIEFRYSDIWLRTFEYETKEVTNMDNEIFDYTKIPISEIIKKYKIYITSDFLLNSAADIFLEQIFDVLMKNSKKIEISNFTIDSIQKSRISTEYEAYQNGLKALQILNVLEEAKCLIRIKSNPNFSNEIDLIINEILESDISNAIVFSQESSYKILNTINRNNSNGTDFVLKMITKEFKVLSLTLNNDDIDVNEGRGYKICALPSEFEL